MIVATYDFGWGPEHLTKQFESEVLSEYLRPFIIDDVSTIIVNNCWYGDEQHQQVLQQCQQIRPHRVVLVSMIDAAVCSAEKFSGVAQDVRCVGYYPGPDEIDFWALAIDRWFDVPPGDLMDTSIMSCAFMCLNRKPHHHRQQLYDNLKKANLLDRGLVSMGSGIEGDPPQRSLPEDVTGFNDKLTPNAGRGQNGIINDIMSLGHHTNWRSCFLNVVTETHYDLHKIHFVSEKIYKPIMGMRPFLVYAKSGAVPWLQRHGFEPYVDDFRDMTDLDLSHPSNLVPFLSQLSEQPAAYFREKMLVLKEKILYNRNNFEDYVQSIKSKLKKGIACQI